MKIKISGGTYTLIETPVTELDLKNSNDETVYSILALYPHGDYAESHFVYDVARDKRVAENILKKVISAKPDKHSLIDTVSELL